MSLKAFHTFFIVVSFLFSAYFGGWAYNQYTETQSIAMLSMTIASFVAAAGLALYLMWFLKKLKAVSFLGIAYLAFIYSTKAEACGVCLGNPNSPLTKSVNEGVWFLLVIVGGVLVSFASLFLFWRHRSKQFQLGA